MDNVGVPENRFKEHDTISSIIFGNKCTYVEDFAYESCISLEKINEDNVLKSIGKNSFANCKSLSYVDIKNCNDIGEGAFKACISLIGISNDFNDKIKKYTFSDCIKLTDINLSNCKEIEEESFKNCISLKKVSLDKCTKIKENSFLGCSSLSIVILPVCENIYPSAFRDCVNLKRIYISNPTVFCTLQNGNAFQPFDSNNTFFYFDSNMIESYKNDKIWKEYENNLLQIVKNNQIVYIPYMDVDNVKNNTDCGNYGLIEYSNKVKYQNQIFKNNKKLIYIDVPSECEIIVESAFEGCESLNNIMLPNTVKMIEDYAFKDCKSLTSFIIPDSIEELEEGIFAGCENLEMVEGKFTSYDNNAIIYNNKLVCVLSKNNSTTHNISEIDINIKRLGKYCFYGCKNMNSVYIPSNILSIGNYAFKNCENLTEVYFDGNPPILGLDVFGDIGNRDFKIYVPEDKISLYKLVYEDEGYVDKIYAKTNN